VDREVVRDPNGVSSLQPSDIPAFSHEMIALFADREGISVLPIGVERFPPQGGTPYHERGDGLTTRHAASNQNENAT
jgi:hypothetical protein